MAAQIGPGFSMPGRKVDCAILPHASKALKPTPITNIVEPGARQPGKPLTKRELAGFLGISERFIELEVNRGRLRAVRLSNRLLRFRPIDVERWLESSLTAAGESRRHEH